MVKGGWLVGWLVGKGREGREKRSEEEEWRVQEKEEEVRRGGRRDGGPEWQNGRSSGLGESSSN